MGIDKSSLLITDDFEELIDERANIWNAYDATVDKISKLKDFQDEFKNVKGIKVGRLSKSGSPPDEIQEAFSGLEEQMRKIGIAEENIQKYEKEIQEVESNFAKVVVTVAIIGFFLILIIL